MTGPQVTVSHVDVYGDAGQSVIGATVNGDLIQQMITYVRGKAPMYLGSAEISDRISCYVPARNHAEVVTELGLNHAVGLVGPPGSGRETTAIVSMRQLKPDIPVRRFSLEDEDTQEIDGKQACGYLIRAENSGLDKLSHFIEAVRTGGGYLAVIAERQPPSAVANFLPWIPVESPQPLQVYQHWVNKRGPAEWAEWDQAAALLEGARPADARRLADLAAQTGKRAGDITARQAEVAQAYSGWTDELLGWFGRHQAPAERALLVAAATLPEGAEEQYVYAAASSLARRLQIEINGGGLAWCPVTGLRELLKADQEGKKVVFRRIGYAESALRHILADYPLARPDLLGWLADLPTGEAATYGMGSAVAETFADLAAEHGAHEYITKAARIWGDSDLADLAFIALSRTCLHPYVGSRIRRALYDWSRTRGTSQTLKLTIARVCEPLGQAYPSIALTRLKHLGTNSDSSAVSGEVIAAALSLAEQDHRQEVLAAVLGWCQRINDENLTGQQRQRRRQVGAMLFLELAGPVAPSGLPQIFGKDEAADPASCMPGWQAVFDFHGRPGLWDGAIERVLVRWLDAALRHSPVRISIRDVLVGVASPPISFGRGRWARSEKPDTANAEFMIGIVRRWAAIDPADILRMKIGDEIVISLTYPWWRRMLRDVNAKLRMHAAVSRSRRN